MENLKKKVSKSHRNHIHKVCVTQIHYVTRFFTPFLLKMSQFLLKTVIFVSFKNPHFCLFPGVLHVKLKFQDKFYNIIDHNKWPSSEKQDEKCVFRKSCFHQIQPMHTHYQILYFPDFQSLEWMDQIYCYRIQFSLKEKLPP